MCADRCGTAACPAPAISSARSIVASMPWLGEAVTVTVAPSGRASAASRASRSGISSNFGDAINARRAVRCSAGKVVPRRLVSFTATSSSFPLPHHPASVAPDRGS